MQTEKTNLTVAEVFQFVPIDKIDIDPNQPRKTHDEQKIIELKDSIVGKDGQKGVGIIQPLKLRERGERYLITCGERRFKAAVLGGLKEVPATIRNVSDEEALEMQIIENEHREDIHTMEQAAGYKMLADKRNMKLEEIAKRTGKSVHHIRQNIKLNDLIPQWQTIFLKDGISATIALKICVLPAEVQTEFYKIHVSKEDEKAQRPIININEYKFNHLNGDLSLACFDINNSELDKQKGACSGCPFNSACLSLFPGEQEHPRCSNIVCFNNKTALHINKEIAKAKEEPTIVFVYNNYSVPEIVVKLREEGLQVLRIGYGDECREVYEPRKPDWEKFLKNNKQSKTSQKKLKEEFQKEEETYTFQMETFTKWFTQGKYRKAFMVDSRNDHETGKYLYVEIIPKVIKPTGKDNQTAIKQGNASLAVIENEEARIKNNEAHGKERDSEKVQKKIAEAIKEDKTINKLPTKVKNLEYLMIRHLLLEHLEYYQRAAIQKVIKIAGLWNPKNKEEYWKALQSLTKNHEIYIARHVIKKKYSSNLPTTPGGYMFRLMAECLGTVPIADYERHQAEEAKKRQARTNRSLAELAEVKKEVLKTEKKAKRKTLPPKEKIRA